MIYQVLARKWRPKHFSEVIAQESVATALTHALSTQHMHHAYLFTGMRGVGKTTIARILAKCLNCEAGLSTDPCLTCACCRDIDQGCFTDFIEVDAASRTRVEDTKELLDNVSYLPTQGRYKIYLIDEVHMLSNHSFNALLKTLEEPPAHVIFLLATTEPSRLPKTVLSRCLHFNLRAFSVPELIAQMKKILETEQIAFELPALGLLAKAAKGSSRDCLSLVEQALGVGQGSIQTRCVVDMLGLGDQRLLLPLMRGLCEQDSRAVFKISAQLSQNGADFDAILEALLAGFHALSMQQLVPDAQSLIPSLSEIDPEILTLHTQISPEQIQLFYQIALSGKRDLAILPDSVKAFEMILLRMLCFRQASPDQMVVSNVKTSLSGSIASPQSIPQLTPQSPQSPQSIPLGSERPVPSKPVISPVSAPSESSDSPDWRELINKLVLNGIVKLIAQHCVIQYWALPTIRLGLAPAQQPFLNKEREEQLAQALTAHFKQPIALKIVMQSQKSVNTPAEIIIAEQTQKQKDVIALLAKDELMNTLVDVFDATLTEVIVDPDD